MDITDGNEMIEIPVIRIECSISKRSDITKSTTSIWQGDEDEISIVVDAINTNKKSIVIDEIELNLPDDVEISMYTIMRTRQARLFAKTLLLACDAMDYKYEVWKEEND